MEIKIQAKDAYTTYAEWDRTLELKGEGREVIIGGNLTVKTDELMAALSAIRGGLDASSTP